MPPRTARWCLLFTLPLVLAACAPEAEPRSDAPADVADTATPAATVDPVAEEQAIRDRIAAYEEAANANAQALADFFLPDGVVMPPNAPAARGPSGVAEAMGPMFEMVDGVDFQTESIDMAESGELAVEYGQYSLTGTLPDDSPFSDEGSYLVTWKKEDGEWMVLYDIFNSDQPAPGDG